MSNTKLDIEKILLQDEHIIAVIDNPHVNIPHIPYTSFPLDVRLKAMARIDYLTQYLNAPLIFDNFGNDHTRRRQWRQQMNEKYGEEFHQYYQHNKLRANVLFACSSSFTLLGMYHQGPLHSSILFLDYFSQASLPSPQQYATLPLKEKIEVSNHTDKIVLGVFNLLSKESSQK